MSEFYQHLKAGKDHGMVFYGGGSRPGYHAFKPCWALLKHLGAKPWIERAKALGAYSVCVEYTRQGRRETVYQSSKWSRSWAGLGAG